MDKKLTLKLDQLVIDQAKKYAESNHESVSGLVEKYLKVLVSLPSINSKVVNKTVSELSGIISVPHGYDEKDDFFTAKINKHDV